MSQRRKDKGNDTQRGQPPADQGRATRIGQPTAPDDPALDSAETRVVAKAAPKKIEQSPEMVETCFRLRFTDGKSRVISLTGQLPQRILIGRTHACAILLEDDLSVSRTHAAVTVEQTGQWVADLKSGTGTSLNGVRILNQAVLGDNDVITVGETEIDFVRGPRPHGWTSRESLTVQLDESQPTTRKKLPAAVIGLGLAAVIGGSVFAAWYWDRSDAQPSNTPEPAAATVTAAEPTTEQTTATPAAAVPAPATPDPATKPPTAAPGTPTVTPPVPAVPEIAGAATASQPTRIDALNKQVDQLQNKLTAIEKRELARRERAKRWAEIRRKRRAKGKKAPVKVKYNAKSDVVEVWLPKDRKTRIEIKDPKGKMINPKLPKPQ